MRPAAKASGSMNSQSPTAEFVAKPAIDPRYVCFRLRLGRSRIHRWGVYAAERIPRGRKVIEYTGERINRREAKRREHTHYLFAGGPYWSVDGSVGGSGAELINHCCDPNLETRILKGHILYFSRRPICKGEELTVDYNFAWRVEHVQCDCGAKKCRGIINVK
jgi:uncharacterized protein